MSARRPVAALVALVMFAAACAGDEESAGPTATVPTVSTTSTTPVDDDSSSDDTATTSSSTSTTTTSTSTASQPADFDRAAISLTELARFTEPIDITSVDGDPHLWVALRAGLVLRVDPTTGDVVDEVLDMTGRTQAGGERGLLGLAVDDTHLIVNYTDLDGTTRIDAYARRADGVDTDSRLELLNVEQPFGNHNGGGLEFDAQGDLFIGMGDGGLRADPFEHGQNADTLLGAMLRITPTPDGPEPYTIPVDNPFVDGGGRPEIFLIGVRNPWRFSFDPVTDDLWIADVGQNEYEEVSLLLGANGAGLGTNLGWARREGLHSFNGGSPPPGNVDPVFEYDHDDGCSVSGGEVYRGSANPDLVGSYLFGDYCTSRIWAVNIDDGTVRFRDLDTPVPGGDLVGIESGIGGELYALSLDGGIYRIDPA